MHRIALLALILSAGCADAPRFDGLPSDRAQNADYPDIVPLRALMDTLPAPGVTVTIGNLEARAANLRARAAALRGPVVDSRQRTRLLAAVARFAR